MKSGVLARLTAVFFIDEERGWVAGSNGTLLASENGGESWKKAQLPQAQQGEMLRDIWVMGAGRMLLLGEYDIMRRRPLSSGGERIFLLASGDHGVNWEIMPHDRLPMIEESARIVRKSETEMLLEPAKMRHPPDPVLVRMDFVDGGFGWACGEGGTIQHSANHGATWTMLRSGARKLLYDVAAVDEKLVWVCGAGGLMLHTVDGGNKWTRQTTGVEDALRAVDFSDANTGWAAGSNGTIIVTYDGGKNWQKQNAPTVENLNDILLLDSEGWAIGDKGVVIHTLDGGRTWTDESLDIHANLTRLFFVSPDNGWLVGANGVIFKYERNRSTEE